MDENNTGAERQRAKRQGFLPGGRDKQELILLLAKEAADAACTKLAKKEEPKSIVPSGWMRLAAEQAETLEIEISGCHVTVTAPPKRTNSDHRL